MKRVSKNYKIKNESEKIVNKQKRNYSISLKITLIVAFVSAALIITLAWINFIEQESFIAADYNERGIILARSLDINIENEHLLNDTDRLQTFIDKINDSNPELLQISINLVDENDQITIFVSSDKQLIGKNSSFGNYDAFVHFTNKSIDPSTNKSKVPPDAKYEPPGENHIITVFTPVNISGKVVGTYEMHFSMDDAYENLYGRWKQLSLSSAVALFIVIIGYLFIFRQVIVKPIITFRDDAKRVGKGDMDVKIDIKSRDELGELANAFNQMTRDLKTSRTKIQRYSKTLENLLKQKDEFIGQLGHDLKNPLQPLVGLLPIIEEQEKDPKLKEHLHLIVHNVEYMRDLIFETLELARLRSSDIKFDIKSVNLKEEIDSILERQQLYLKENKMNVKNQVSDTFFVEADTLRLAELLNNLITNAVKYTPKGSGIIKINAKRDEEFVAVSINDNGIGMTKEQIDRIFDEFYMADESRRRVDSSGLGLAICKRIVEKHGGKIWVESSGKNKGSTFYFTLKVGDRKKDKGK